MKYFTPELILLGQSNDERELEKQNLLWEKAGEQYVAYLDSIRSRFPAGLRRIDENYYLHDSVIRAMGSCGQQFVIILQLDTPPQSILMLTYDLVEEPTIAKGSLPAELCKIGAVADWQYNEIELVPGDPPTWRETLLLSNGWELDLHFSDVHVQEVQAVLPAPRLGLFAHDLYAAQTAQA